MSGLAELVRVRGEVAGLAASFDPSVLTAEAAAVAVSHLVAVRNMASALEAACAARVAESEVWRRAGCRSAEDWLAKRSGTSTGQAAGRLASGKRMAAQPKVAAAAKTGALSPEQTALVSDAAAADPEAEERLVALAARSSVGELRDACQRVKAAADPDRDATHARIKAARRLREWTDGEGAWNLAGRSVVEDGAEVHAALDDIANDLFERARNDGRRESREAYLLDALVELARRHNQARRGGEAAPAGGGKQRKPGYLALLRLDVTALMRGAVEGEEVCEIAGIGPVPVRIARELLGDAVLKLVLTKGVDVGNVTHLGRGPSVAQKLALLWMHPLCVVEGCHRRWRQVDHREDWAKVKVTELWNLDCFCDHDHDKKTRYNWAMVPGTGKRPMVPPDDPRHPRNCGPPAGAGGP